MIVLHVFFQHTEWIKAVYFYIRCEPISFPVHFLLRFCESSDPKSDWYYIDVFNGGQIVRRGACPHSNFSGSRDMFPVANAAQVVERMANNLEVRESY